MVVFKLENKGQVLSQLLPSYSKISTAWFFLLSKWPKPCCVFSSSSKPRWMNREIRSVRNDFKTNLRLLKGQKLNNTLRKSKNSKT